MCDTGVVEFQYRTEIDDDEGAIKYMFDHMEKMSKHMRGRATDLPWEYVNCFFKQVKEQITATCFVPKKEN
jgi:hypothetical protein